MKKKNVFKWWGVVLLLCMCSVHAEAQDLKSILTGVAKAAIGNKATTAHSIVGTWSLEGSTPDNPNIMTFGKDGKGTEETRSGISNFTYTLSPVNQNGVMPLKIYFIDSEVILNFDATRTGNTLMLSSNNKVRIYNKI